MAAHGSGEGRTDLCRTDCNNGVRACCIKRVGSWFFWPDTACAPAWTYIGYYSQWIARILALYHITTLCRDYLWMMRISILISFGKCMVKPMPALNVDYWPRRA